MNEGLKVTRKMMLQKVYDRITDGAGNPDTFMRGNSYAAWGYNRRLKIAQALYRKIDSSGTPSTKEVVAYFGKGARFVEGE